MNRLEMPPVLYIPVIGSLQTFCHFCLVFLSFSSLANEKGFSPAETH